MEESRSFEIVAAASAEQIEEIRALWREYWDSLGFAPDFQNFAQELNALPGAYAPPGGRLLLARVDGKPAGSAAFRRLTESRCEAKRFYVRPQYRGLGLGKALLGSVLRQARTVGYSAVYADTFAGMEAALLMYKQAGFTEVAPYSPDPTPGAIFLKLDL